MIEILLKITQEIQFITYESVIAYFFTTLGIFVTLISITSALNKEIRQKLLVKYFSKDWIIKSYTLFLLSSFIFSIVLLLCSFQFEKELLLGITIILFIFSLFFVIYFIKHLNREHFNKLILKEIKKEIKQIRINKFPTSLVDFVSNIGYVQRNNFDFTEEQETFRKIVKLSLDSHNSNLPLQLIGRIENINDSLFDSFLNSLYSLKFSKEPKFITSIKYQNLLVQMIKKAFLNVTDIRPKLNTAGLYIKEFFDSRLLKRFEETTNEEEINGFKRLAENTINSIFDLCKTLINLEIPNKIKKIYLFSQLAYLNKSLEFIEHIHETDFCKEYYDYKFNDKNSKLILAVETKTNLVKNLLNYLQKKKLELMFIILHKIETRDLSKDFFYLVEKIYYSKKLKEEFFKTQRIDFLDWTNYDDFDTGVQMIAPFNLLKFKLLLLLLDFTKNKNNIIEFQKLQKEHFNDTQYTFQKEIKILNLEFINLFFEINKTELSAFSKKLEKEIKKKLKELNIKEKSYKANSLADKKYVEKFKKDVLLIWKENQNKLRNFINIRLINPKKIKEEYWGQFKLYPKEWFLEPFYNNVSMARDTGNQFGESQVRSKNEIILKKAYEKIKSSHIIKINKQNFIEVLMHKKILKPNKEYFFAFNFKRFELYSLKGIKWINKDLIQGTIKINNSTLNFINIHSEDYNLLFEKNAIILEQYKKGFKNINELIYINVETKFSKKEITKLVKSELNELNNESDVKELLKIRVSEKFNVKLDSSKDIFGIDFD